MKNIMKKVLIVDPYLDVFGGGEKHILSIGKVFEKQGFSVSLFWSDKEIISELSDRLHIDLSSFTIESTNRKGEEYDVLLYVTDGSYFFPKAKKNFVFCMYPQRSLYTSSLLNKLKWRNWNFFANSHYTSQFISTWTGKEVSVVYPFIDEEIFKQYTPINKKEKIILSVGRFFEQLHAKNQHVLIEAFNKLQKGYEEMREFKFVLIGGVKEEDEKYFNKVLELSKNNPNIIIVKNTPYKTILSYYSKSLIYWHGAGLGSDLEKFPESTEHLGMSVVEAMASGCITLAHNSGGPKETIADGKTGYLYNSIEDLIDKTVSAVSSKELDKISQSASEYCKKTFSYNEFEKNVILSIAKDLLCPSQ